jgi:hypothetical protein
MYPLKVAGMGACSASIGGQEMMENCSLDARFMKITDTKFLEELVRPECLCM